MKGSIPGIIPLITYTPIQTNVLSKIKHNEDLTDYEVDVVIGDAASYMNTIGSSRQNKSDEVINIKKYIKDKYGINDIPENLIEKIKSIAKLSV